MLTATRLFAGATVSDTLAAVLKTEPDWTTLPAGTPPPIRCLLRRCLEKDRKRRLDSAAGAQMEIDDALTAWVAYQTDESGRFEVVVKPSSDAGGKWQVSTAGGVAPRWRADGKELYVLAPDATMMAVPVTAAGAFGTGTPVALFPTRIVEGGTAATNRPQYAVARDGRLLINQPVADATAAPVTLLLNWQGGLPARDQR